MKTAQKKWKLPAAKVKVLRWIEKQILEEPKRFDMDELINLYTKEFAKEHSYLPACGTVACIAGWYTLKTKGKLKPDGTWTYGDVDVWFHAQRELQLNDISSRRLFLAGDWPEPFNTDYADAWGNRERQAEIAVARIEHFIKTGE